MSGHIWLPFLRNQLRAHQELVYRVSCPHCKAAAGQPCRGPSKRRLHQPHRSREESAGVVTAPSTPEAS